MALLLLKKICGDRHRVGNGSARKNVLIVRLDVIGDFVLWLNAAKTLRSLFPQEQYTITLMGNSSWTDLAKHLPYFDDIWPVDRQALVESPASFVELMRKLRELRFDAVLHPVYSREFLFGDFFVWASAAHEKIGMEGDLLNEFRWQKRLGDRFYTRLIPCPADTRTEIERNAVFLRGIGQIDFKTELPVLAGDVGTPFSLPYPYYYVVFPGASVAARRWPVENFASLIDRIHTTNGLPAVVCGGPAENGLGEALERCASGPVLNLAGKTSLSELVSVIAGARFLIGNETGAVHIAAAVGIPSICILGGGHFGRFIPYSLETNSREPLPIPVFSRMDCYGCNWKCIYQLPPAEAVPCIKMISVDAVVAATSRLTIAPAEDVAGRGRADV